MTSRISKIDMPDAKLAADAAAEESGFANNLIPNIADTVTEASPTLSDILQDWVNQLSAANIAAQLGLVACAVVLGFFLARAINARVLAFSITSRAAEGEESGRSLFVLRLRDGLVRFVKELFQGVSFSLIAGSIIATGSYALTTLFGWSGASLIFCRIAYNFLYAFALLAVMLQIATVMVGSKVISPAVRRIVKICFWVLVILQFVGVLGQVVGFMESTKLPFGGGQLTVWTFFVGILTILLALGIANWIADLCETVIESAKGLSLNVQVALSRVVRILLFVIAVCVSLSSVGIDLTVLSVFGGALGVGLGFGLQKIASNYISGFIILLDRSIKIGDLVEVAGFRGRITAINTRFTVVRNNDGIECIVPNENFVTSAVKNHSYTEEPVVQYIDISVAYDADVKRALAIMLEEGMRERPRIVPGRRGWSYLDSFGDSGINLRLGFWVADPVNGVASLRTQISTAIYERFRQEGIEVPYNQLEINIRKADAPAVRVLADTKIEPNV